MSPSVALQFPQGLITVTLNEDSVPIVPERVGQVENNGQVEKCDNVYRCCTMVQIQQVGFGLHVANTSDQISLLTVPVVSKHMYVRKYRVTSISLYVTGGRSPRVWCHGVPLQLRSWKGTRLHIRPPRQPPYSLFLPTPVERAMVTLASMICFSTI